ncbi:lysine methyltransferase 5Ab [Melanotaenia boesemani]|uniref:lysine methyltransferase 5Ab n=1 Tax=Melanotaenia boesemani TaxID=1250792 RepID=UPI001C04CCEE|nr:lysine methyltransferase 5Ab [Melanotaenia boesemani]
MAKGKKNVLKVDKKPQDTTEHKVPSQTETKENKPATSKNCVGKVQSILQSLRTPRSPLSDNTSMRIQEGNDSDASTPNVSTLKKDIPSKIKHESCEAKEQKPELVSHSHVTKVQDANQLEHKETITQQDVTSAKSSKVPASNPRKSTSRKNGAKKTENRATQNKKVTDYFPIRRSNRKTKTELKGEEHKHIDDLIKNGTEEGMQVRHIEGKGRGVFAMKDFKKGDYVVEYHGDLLDLTQAKMREDKYAEDPQTGCYMYYFQYQSKTYCVDATKETGRLGRLINHSKTGNCQTRLHVIDGTPHLILVASRDIEAEEELLYDYGDRSKASVSAHPWLKY